MFSCKRRHERHEKKTKSYRRREAGRGCSPCYTGRRVRTGEGLIRGHAAGGGGAGNGEEGSGARDNMIIKLMMVMVTVTMMMC